MKKKILLTLLFISSISYAQISTNNIRAKYGFDNGTVLEDSSPGGNDFTQTGSALTEVNDRFNNAPTSAISLNGDRLTRTDISIAGSNPFSDAFDLSYSFWLKTSTNTGDNKTIIDDSNRDRGTGFDGTQSGYFISYKNGKINVTSRYVTTNPTPGFQPSRINYNHEHPTVIADGEWHHIVILISATESLSESQLFTNIYVDNVLDANSNRTFPITTSPNGTGNVTIANTRTNRLTMANRYTDIIDDILIYNRKFTTAEVATLAEFNNYCFAPAVSILSTSNITDTAATVHIASNAGDVYDIAFHKTSEPFSNATIITGVTSATATSQASLTGLDIGTNYSVYVREQCSRLTDWSNATSFTTTRPSGILYVDENAAGTNDGLSWTNAYTDLQDALSNSVTNDEIWIAKGTYKPHTSDRNKTFDITTENLKIYGGFAGTETLISDRVLGTNETILSGDLQGNDVNVADFIANYGNTTRNADNSYHVINITAAGNNLLLDGLTISDAHNNLNATESGGAIVKYKIVAKLVLKNCIVKDNVSRNGNAGLLAEFELNNTSGTRGALVIENTKFINNMARWASGIYSFARANSNVDITIANSLFDNNLSGNLNTTTATGLGGSAFWFRMLANGSDVNLNLVNNTYVNHKDFGTGQGLNNFTKAVVGISKGSGITSTFNATISNCIFWDNLASTNGSKSRSITDLYESPLNSLTVTNSLDPLGFNDNSISAKTNNISSDPSFNTDFSLKGNSPAINVGLNSSVFGTKDLLGNTRIFDTTVDLGAYEFGASAVAGLATLSKIDFSLYPNPTNGILNIKIDENIKLVEIFNLQGQKIITSKNKNLNIKQLNAGIYLLKITTDKNLIGIKKIIKK